MKRAAMFSVALLIGAGSAVAADPLHFYVGFTSIQTQTTSEGALRYSNVQVGSNEDNSQAQPYTIFFQLGVRGGDGSIVCNTGVELLTKVRPAVQPLRFQIFHPEESGRLKRPLRLAQKSYTLSAKIEVRMPGTSQLLQRESNEVTYQFPAGGTPSCEILMKP